MSEVFPETDHEENVPEGETVTQDEETDDIEDLYYQTVGGDF